MSNYLKWDKIIKLKIGQNWTELKIGKKKIILWKSWKLEKMDKIEVWTNLKIGMNWKIEQNWTELKIGKK